MKSGVSGGREAFGEGDGLLYFQDSFSFRIPGDVRVGKYDLFSFGGQKAVGADSSRRGRLLVGSVRVQKFGDVVLGIGADAGELRHITGPQGKGPVRGGFEGVLFHGKVQLVFQLVSGQLLAGEVAESVISLRGVAVQGEKEGESILRGSGIAFRAYHGLADVEIGQILLLVHEHRPGHAFALGSADRTQASCHTADDGQEGQYFFVKWFHVVFVRT